MPLKMVLEFDSDPQPMLLRNSTNHEENVSREQLNKNC